MGLGCRNVAYIIIIWLFLLDQLSYLAVKSKAIDSSSTVLRNTDSNLMESLVLCPNADNENSQTTQQNKIVTINNGAIYSKLDKNGNTISSDPYQTCKINLISESHHLSFRVSIERNTIIGGNNENINQICKDSEPYLAIQDNLTGFQTKLCGRIRSDSQFDFDSGNITISFYSGAWRTPGFRFYYETLCLGQERGDQSVGCDLSGPETNLSTSDKETEGKNAEVKGRGNDSKTRNSVKEGNFRFKNFDYYDSSYTDDEETKPKPNQKSPKQGMLGQNLMWLTIVGICLIMFIILIAAGIIACHRTREQEEIIKNLSDRLDRVTESRSLINPNSHSKISPLTSSKISFQ